MANAAGPATFQRKPPGLLARWGLGLAMTAVFGPAIRILDKLGLAERMGYWGARKRRERLVQQNPFRNYVPSEHDVFVATYVKSGTNWMMQIVHQLLNNGTAEFEHIHCAVPWPDTAMMGPLRGYAIPIQDPSIWMASPERKRAVKTHFDWDLIPYSEEARYILVIRDPKDVFVSSFHFFVKGGPLAGTGISKDTWLRLFLSPNFPMGGSWALNTAGYWAQRHKPNVLILSFKSMKRDLRGTVLTVAEFLDMQPSPDLIDRVCEQASFENMKRIDEKFRPWKFTPWSQPAPMMRKGLQGGSSELLSPEQQREVDAYFMTELKRLGSNFPYAEFCDVAPQLAQRQYA